MVSSLLLCNVKMLPYTVQIYSTPTSMTDVEMINTVSEIGSDQIKSTYTCNTFGRYSDTCMHLVFVYCIVLFLEDLVHSSFVLIPNVNSLPGCSVRERCHLISFYFLLFLCN